MSAIIDLSQEIYHRAPSLPPFPVTQVYPYITHEEIDGQPAGTGGSANVSTLILCDHSSTHVDAFSHFHYAPQCREETIDKMKLDLFYTRGICIDLSHFAPGDLIGVKDIETGLKKGSLTLQENDTILLYTDHYRRTFEKGEFFTGWPGIAAEVVEFFAHHKAVAFGVESPAPGVLDSSNAPVHRLCGELRVFHYENLINLHQLVNRGPFRFVAFPLKIRAGAGSPVRAAAVFEAELPNEVK